MHEKSRQLYEPRTRDSVLGSCIHKIYCILNERTPVPLHLEEGLEGVKWELVFTYFRLENGISCTGT
jgi:hypothetical protein